MKKQPCKVKTVNRLADLPIKTPEEAKKILLEKFSVKECKDINLQDLMNSVRSYNLRVEIIQYGQNWTYDFSIMKLENLSWIISAEMFYSIKRGICNWELMGGTGLVRTSKALESSREKCLERVTRGNEMLTLKKASRRNVGYSICVENK